MHKEQQTNVDHLDATELRLTLKGLEATLTALGPHTPIRQVMALILVALENKGRSSIGVRDIDAKLGDLSSGSASKLLRSMMHVETERKAGVADTLRSERDPHDLRRYDLHVTDKGAEALTSIINAMNGR